MIQIDKGFPEAWRDRCSGDGHRRYIDQEGIRRYCDNDEPVGETIRPCAKCGQYPTSDGDDYCLQHLGQVMNACCGHGGEGYIQFDNDVMIRGVFKITDHSGRDITVKTRRECNVPGDGLCARGERNEFATLASDAISVASALCQSLDGFRGNGKALRHEKIVDLYQRFEELKGASK